MRLLSFRWVLRALLVTLSLVWAIGVFWQSHHKLPPGLTIAGGWQPLPPQQVRFLYDSTAAAATGAPLVEQQIQPELLRLIGQSREFVVIDAGLFGDLPAAGPGAQKLRNAAELARPLTDALIAARQRTPTLQILLLTDPASQWLGSGSDLLTRLRQAGIVVVPVDVDRLRAPNPWFGAAWRLCCNWWTHAQGVGEWPNPLAVGSDGLSFGLWGRLESYQRSHRQLLIGDDGAGGITGLVFSRPLHAEAGLHSATALQLSGRALAPLLESEFVLAQFSGWSGGGAMQARAQHLIEQIPTLGGGEGAQARVLSESAAAQALILRIDATVKGDSIDVAALYLAQRDLVRVLLEAARRGVAVRALLDPGKDGYGYARSGLPNREVAAELVASSDGALRVRWYRTHGEQFSPSLIRIQGAGRVWLWSGTAELRHTDFDGLNLAAAFVADLPPTAAAASDALSWFDTLWYNRAAGGVEYSSDADVYEDASQLNYWQYRVQEGMGASFD